MNKRNEYGQKQMNNTQLKKEIKNCDNILSSVVKTRQDQENVEMAKIKKEALLKEQNEREISQKNLSIRVQNGEYRFNAKGNRILEQNSK